MSKITALLQKMKSLCNSNNGKDTFNSPVTAEEISDWEIAHNVKLCDELKEFYLFSNGMNLRIYFSTFNKNCLVNNSWLWYQYNIAIFIIIFLTNIVNVFLTIQHI